MRYDKLLTVAKMFPQKEVGKCAYCGGGLSGRQRRWCGRECERSAVNTMLIRKGDVKTLRQELLRRDHGICAGCGSPQDRIGGEWHADHITAVVNGGGLCGLEGYQTLCLPCHKAKTISDVRQARSRDRFTPTNTEDK